MADDKEREIPVFTVWKNNAILKNIFLINSPPTLDKQNEEHQTKSQNQELEETLLVGRHPDCDIRLEHPSISRFHLRIHSIPSSKILFLSDLSSVHGTWVSGKRIDPDIRIRIGEGDTLRIGGSSRVYKLHWIPLSQAYDVSKPFVPPLDFPEPQEDEEEIIKDENSLGLTNEEVHAVDNVSDDVSKGLESLAICDNDELDVEKIAPEEPPLQPDKTILEKDEDIELDLDFGGFQQSPFLDENSQVLEQKETPSALIQNEEFENEYMQSVDSILEGVADFDVDGLESLVLCDNDELDMEKVTPEAPGMQPDKPVIEKDENIESVSFDFNGLQSLFLDDNPQVLEQKETLSAPMIQNEEFENEDVQQSLVSTLEDVTALDFGGLESLILDQTSQVLEHKETYPAPLIQNEELENEDVQSVDSVLEGLVPLFMGENWEWVGLEENYLPCPTEDDHLLSSKNEDLGLVNSVLEELDALFLDENSELLAQEVIPSAPPMPEDMAFPVASNLVQTTAGGGSDVESEMIQGKEIQRSLQEENVQNGTWNFWNESLITTSSLATEGARLNTEYHHLGIENQHPEHESEPTLSSEDELLGSINVYQTSSGMDHKESQLWSFWSGKMGVESVCSYLSDAEPFSESEKGSVRNGYQSPLLSSIKRQFDSPLITSGEKTVCSSRWSSRRKLDSICSSLSDAESFSELERLSELENKSSVNGYQSPLPLNFVKSQIGSPSTLSEQKPPHSIWSRRGKLQSAPQVLTSRTEGKKMKTDQTVKPEPISRALFHGTHNQEEEEEEIFTPDKENFTPNTHKSMRKLAILKEVKNSRSGKSPLLKMTGSTNNFYEDIVSPSSDKENYSAKVLMEQKTARRASPNHAQSVRLKDRKGERMPFQSLLADSPQKILSEGQIPDAAMASGNSVNCAKAACKEQCPRERIRQWNMVVDTTTLLNKESRKALQLLEGLKGTQLIIPRIVIRDLACLNRQTSFFRRNTEVSSALEWIQDCMVKTQWWIHVQNSMEEGRPVAPTPPASPHSQLSCGTAGSYAISALESRGGLLSPTVEDDVLDYALCFRRMNNDGQLVLLSQDVTLKIKAMSEGLICETAEEFRESLVNPFSERFLWTDSSPRGQTWSCADDIVLREKFYPSSLKMTPKAMENVKGLKLILLHNSQFYERMTPVR